MIIKSPVPDVFVEDRPLHEYILDKIKGHGDCVALINGETGKTYTYREIYNLSYSLAASLHRIGIDKGDFVTLILPNIPETAFIYLGISLTGAVVAPCNPAYTTDEFQRHLKTCGAKFIFTIDVLIDKVLKATKAVDNIKLISAVITNPRKPLPKNITNFQSLISTKPDFNLPKIKFWTKTELCWLPSSSGTTGFPKGVLVTHYNLMTILAVYGNKSSYLLPHKGEHILAFLPFFHIFGFGTLIHGLRDGIKLVTIPAFHKESLLGLIEKYKIRIFYCVPPILVMLVKDPIVKKYDVSSIEVIFTGAAPTGKEFSEELIRVHPNIKHIIQAYGLTETGPCHITLPPEKDESKHGSCGQVACNYQCKVIDLDSRKPLGPNQKGEICIKGTAVASLGYLNRPEATKELMDSDGWLHTGDVGYYDDDEYFYIVDRIKELIKVKGFQVAPAELEDALLAHPQIHDTAVVGIPHPTDGEVPMAFIVPEDHIKLEKDKIQTFMKEKVAAYKQLKGGIEFVNELPKSPSGKLLRRILRQKALEMQKKSKL